MTATRGWKEAIFYLAISTYLSALPGWKDDLMDRIPHIALVLLDEDYY